MSDKKWVEIFGENVKETDDAVKVDDGDTSVWIPKQFMEDWPDEGEDGDFIIEEWIALETELI